VQQQPEAMTTYSAPVPVQLASTPLVAAPRRRIPAPFWGIAIVGSVVGTLFWLPVAPRLAGLIPLGPFTSEAHPFLPFWLLSLAMTPLALLMSVWPATALAAPRTAAIASSLGLLPLLFHQVFLAAVVTTVATAMVLMWREPRWAIVPAGLTVVSMAYAIGGRATLAISQWRDIDFVKLLCEGASCRNDYSGTPGYALLWSLGLAIPLALAWWLARQAETAEATRLERQALTVQTAQVDADAAVVAERARLARDLHDVVAHHVSLIAVRAETAPYTLPDTDAQTRAAFTEIAADARLALDELRGVLGILQRADSDDRAPQPTLGDIAALVERARAAGADVTLHGDVDIPIGLGTGYVAYRLVQESLTNARRHAPGAPVRVEVTADGDLVVRVTHPLTGSPAGTPGRGLVGMRERVEALGGLLIAGPVGDEFVVSARLPLRQSALGDSAR
jgi:signal transduction histidine kinase